MVLIAKPVIRLYRMEDELMQTRATTMHGNLTDDLAAFQALFPWIDAAFLASFLADINTAKNFPLDGASTGSIKVLTEDLDTSVAEGMKELDRLDVYARLAYPDSPAKQRIFGQDKWEKARNDQQKMCKALKLAHSFANQVPYKTALLAEGMTQANIDNLLTIADNIDLKDTLQEKAISGRPVTTEERIQVNNIVWKRQQQISVCSELVWREDAAKRDQYLLYPPTPASLGDTAGYTIEEIIIPANSSFQIELDTPVFPNLELFLQAVNGLIIVCTTNLPPVDCTAGYQLQEGVIFKDKLIELGLDLTKTHIQFTNPGNEDVVLKVGRKNNP